jgi:hypothetical protein
MTTFTTGATLNNDGSLTDYYFPDNSSAWQVETSDAASVLSDVSQWAQVMGLTNGGSGVDPAHKLGTMSLIMASLGVKQGLFTPSALINWAEKYNVQVSEIPNGTNVLGQQGNAVTESFVQALYDSRASNAPALEASHLNAELIGAGTSAITNAGDYLHVSTAALGSIALNLKAQATGNASNPGPSTIASENPLANLVQEAYLAYYGRPADAAGEGYWIGQLALSGGNLSSIINAFGNSAESLALYGNGNTAQVVTQIYEQLFGRSPDTAGRDYWVGLINAGAVSPAGAALSILQGATGQDKALLTDKLVTATLFTSILTADTQASAQYSGNTAASNARSYLSAVDSTASATVDALAKTLPAVIHDIQGSITADLAAVGVTVNANVELIGVVTTESVSS